LFTIPPRQGLLLTALTDADEAVPVSALSERLGVSKRTVMRELGNVDLLLAPYGIRITTEPGKGVGLEGSEEDLERFREDFRPAADVPAGRDERRLFLALDILTNPEQQKLFVWSNRFLVSDATVSHDLDAVEPLFRRFGLKLTRKPGYGVSSEGSETLFRSAICYVLSKLERSGAGKISYPPADVRSGVREIIAGVRHSYLARMTSESAETFSLYLSVMIQRVREEREIARPENPPGASYLAVAGMLSDLIQKRFDIRISEAERSGIAVCLTAGRVNADAREVYADADFDGGSDKKTFLNIVYRMIENFDSPYTDLLKHDDQLAEGLCAHLKTLFVRLANSMEMEDPLYDQITRDYPEILEKSRRAASVLSEFYDYIPESEIGYFATHFGAALLRLEENRARRKKIRIGLMCENGIGTSYLMLSQVKRHFSQLADAEICLGENGDTDKFDLVLSSIPASGRANEKDERFIFVSPILTDDDIAAVAKAIRNMPAVGSAGAKTGHDSPLGIAEAAMTICRDVTGLLENFGVVRVAETDSLDDIMKTAGYLFGKSEKKGRRIYRNLRAREALTSQVIPELGIALLHARTEAVEGPLLSIAVAEGGAFQKEEMKGIRACVLMLLPKSASVERGELLGRISGALVDNPAFLSAVQNGDRETSYKEVEKMAEDYLAGMLQRLVGP
jgi:mannitol operon transcriptional antiterminator